MLIDDVAALGPTIFVGVPRVYDRIHGAVMDGVRKASLLKRCLFNYAWWRKWYYMQAGYPHASASVISDVLVFSKVKARLGGRVRLLISGGAPLASHVEQFLRVAMCCPVAQGYGLTETCAASFVASPNDVRQAGTVGPPLASTELRLQSVPDMGYDATGSPPKGEICIRGPGLFSG